MTQIACSMLHEILSLYTRIQKYAGTNSYMTITNTIKRIEIIKTYCAGKSKGHNWSY